MMSLLLLTLCHPTLISLDPQLPLRMTILNIYILQQAPTQNGGNWSEMYWACSRSQSDKNLYEPFCTLIQLANKNVHAGIVFCGKTVLKLTKS